jgi:hypothetical protein
MKSYRALSARAAMAALLFVSGTPVSVLAEGNASVSAANGASEALTFAVDRETGARRLPLADLQPALASDARLQLFSIADKPGLYVMQAASLAQQGAMFARIVALLERRDMPRNRVVPAAAIAAHARRFGTDPAGLTAGNNFSTVELAHFFEVAREQGVALSRDERVLRTILVRWHLVREEQRNWKAVSVHDFLITIPGLGPGPGGETVDTAVRAAILSHELGHWQYFSNSAYAKACRTFWWRVLNYEERAELTRQLAKLGYDPSDRVVIDEMQAYLLHTPAEYMPIVHTTGVGGLDVGDVRRRLQESVRAGPAARELAP